MKRFLRGKWLVMLAAVAVAAVAAIGGYAYFSASGSGTGGAIVGTTKEFGVHGMASGPLYPGTGSDVNFTAYNPGEGYQRLGTIVLTDIKACPDDSLWYAGGGPGSPAGCYWFDPQNANPRPAELTMCESFSGGVTNDTTKNFWMAPVVANQDIPPSSAGATFTDVTQTGRLVMNNLDTSQDACKNAELLLYFVSR